VYLVHPAWLASGGLSLAVATSTPNHVAPGVIILLFDILVSTSKNLFQVFATDPPIAIRIDKRES